MTPSERGIRRALDAQASAKADWKSGGKAQGLISDYVLGNTLFTTDDIWREVLEPAIQQGTIQEPDNRRVLGALINSLSSEGMIMDSGTTAKSTRRNGALLTVWRTGNRTKKSFIRSQSAMKPFGNNRIQNATNNLKSGISKTESDIKEYEQKIRKMRANNAFDQELLKKLREQGYNRRFPQPNDSTQYLVGIYNSWNEEGMPDVGDRFNDRFDIDSLVTAPKQTMDSDNIYSYGFNLVLADPITEEIVYVSETTPYDPDSGLAGNNLIRENYTRNRYGYDGWLLLPDSEGKIPYADFYNTIEAKRGDIEDYLMRLGQQDMKLYPYEPSISAQNKLMFAWASDEDYFYDPISIFDRLYRSRGTVEPIERLWMNDPRAAFSNSGGSLGYGPYLSQDFLYAHPMRIPSPEDYDEIRRITRAAIPPSLTDEPVVNDAATLDDQEVFGIINALTEDEYDVFRRTVDGTEGLRGRFSIGEAALSNIILETASRYRQNAEFIQSTWVDYLGSNEDFLYELAYDPSAEGLVEPKDLQVGLGGSAPNLVYHDGRYGNLPEIADTETGRKYQIMLRSILMASREVRREKDALALAQIEEGQPVGGFDVDSVVKSIMGNVPALTTMTDLRDPARISGNPEAVADYNNPWITYDAGRMNNLSPIERRTYYRNLSGKRYHGSNRLLKKHHAKALANHAKQRGLYARVISAKGGHRIYVAKKVP